MRRRHPIQAVFDHAGRRQWRCRLRGAEWHHPAVKLPADSLPRYAIAHSRMKTREVQNGRICPGLQFRFCICGK
jgi:hypothetical protein